MPLRSVTSATDPDLLALAAYARSIAAGREDPSDVDRLLESLATKPSPKQATTLLAVLRASVDRVRDDESSRRKFFHAARAFVSLQRAAI
jgi:hypothetical protein